MATSVEQMIASVSSAISGAGLDRIDVLVNNAAIPMQGQGQVFWKIAPEDWLRMSHTNCDSVFLMSRLVVPAMIDRGFRKGDQRIYRLRYNGSRIPSPPTGPSKSLR